MWEACLDDSLLSDDEAPCDGGVAPALGDQREDLALARGQAVERVRVVPGPGEHRRDTTFGSRTVSPSATRRTSRQKLSTFAIRCLRRYPTPVGRSSSSSSA